MGKTRRTKLVRLADAKRRTLGIEGQYQEFLGTRQVNPPA
jgi:hypothetical protein